MANRPSILPTERVNFFPYSEDIQYLRAKYGIGSSTAERIGYGPAMREIIHAAVKKMREKERLRKEATMQAQYIPTPEEIEDALDPAE